MRGLGVSRSTFFLWLSRGKAARIIGTKPRGADVAYVRMLDVIEEAQARSETFLATAAMTAATKNPAVAAAMLARLNAVRPGPMPPPHDPKAERSWDVALDG